MLVEVKKENLKKEFKPGDVIIFEYACAGDVSSTLYFVKKRGKIITYESWTREFKYTVSIDNIRHIYKQVEG